MRIKLLLLGIILIIIAVSLRAASYIMQFAPIEPTGFGITFPLDAMVAIFGATVFVLGMDPAFITKRVKTYFKTYRDIRKREDKCKD